MSESCLICHNSCFFFFLEKASRVYYRFPDGRKTIRFTFVTKKLMYDKKLKVYFVVFTILYIFATDKIRILVKITTYII
jgi:hypothetical protein